jgi:hypothetical protein
MSDDSVLVMANRSIWLVSRFFTGTCPLLGLRQQHNG